MRATVKRRVPLSRPSSRRESNRADLARKGRSIPRNFPRHRRATLNLRKMEGRGTFPSLKSVFFWISGVTWEKTRPKTPKTAEGITITIRDSGLAVLRRDPFPTDSVGWKNKKDDEEQEVEETRKNGRGRRRRRGSSFVSGSWIPEPGNCSLKCEETREPSRVQGQREAV